ncbi:kinase-like domain-containing protein [Gigaspora rosea]|uniref:non-specific serine/threonine protein kinase n=1 Tax=Gigaspora rosea TaxID=44941 RepID=A0A397V6R5_9GLOM|nr:kinase-like domain-containing protein [Gigaspora rosea]
MDKMDNNLKDKNDNDNKPVVSKNDLDQKTEDKATKPIPNHTQQKEAKTNHHHAGNILQTTLQKMFPSADKPKAPKSSKNSSITGHESEDERTEKTQNTRSTSKQRFQKLNTGSHVHNLQPKKVHRINNFFKDFGIHGHNSVDEKSQNESDTTKKKNSDESLSGKYGKPQEVVGKGAFGIVRIAHKTEPKVPGEKLFAVKEFKKRHNEPLKKYMKRLTSEFCISSSLHHINVIDTIDLLQDTQGNYCEVMEYCSGGDLYSLIISSGGLEQNEADCFFGQLINGVKYLHENGVAHRDLKPENLLLTSDGCLKITDFGNGECFKMAWEKQAHMSRGACGSEPYIAPEAFTGKWFDPRPVDVWACGIIYMGMITARHLWRCAKENEDFNFKIYLESKKHGECILAPFQRLSDKRLRMISKIIEPDPSLRITAEQITEDPWFSQLDICHKPQTKNSHLHTNTTCGVNATNQQPTNLNKLTIMNMV